MRTRIIPTLAAILALVAALLTPVTADTASTLTNTITLDTRGTGRLTVTGRVLNSQTNAALSGASVSLAGLNTTSGSNGTFTLAGVSLTSGNTLTVSASGFITQTQTVSAAAGAKAVSVGDIALAPNTNNPVVEWVKPDLAGLYLYGWNTSTTLRMRVNWNGNTPGQVLVYGNNKLRATLTGAGPEYATTMPVDTWFVAAGLPGVNGVRVVAVGSGSSPLQGEKRIDLAVLPVPQALAAFYLPGNLTSNAGTLTLKVKFPSPALNKTVTLPVIGSFGAKIQAEGELDYNIHTGAWELTLGSNGSHELGSVGSGSSAQVIIGSYTGEAGISATGKGTATLAKGVTFDSLTLTPSLALSGEFRLGAYGLPDLLGPGLSTTLNSFPFLRPALDNVVIVLMVKPSLTGSATLAFVPAFQFQGFDLTGKAALEAFYEPKILGAKARFYVGGEPSLSLQAPGDLFKSAGFRAYAGLTVKAFWMDITFPEYVFVDYTFSSLGANSLPQGTLDTGSGYMIESVGNANMEPRPMARPWRDAGAEQFVAGQASDALASFNLMGQAPAAALSTETAQGPHTMIIPSDPVLPVQAALPLLTNVFPDADPAMAASGSSLMLLYARDTGAVNPLQFTEIAWTRYDGTNWSTPAALAPMANGQLSPKVCFDGNGDAVAVWEQCNDSSYSNGTFEQTASHMEIMWSRWTSATNTWSAAAALTSNSIVDHDARLAGPLPNGDLLLTWIRNAGNKLAGEGISGAATNDQVMVARWVAATHSWQTPTTLVANLSGDTCHSLAVGGSKAAFVWGQDMDGNLANSSDTELFYRVMDASGNWGVATRLTKDSVADLNARVAIDPSGHVYLVWKHGGDLVMQRDFTGVLTVVRADSGSMGVADYSLALGPGGNLLVIWQDMSDVGSDAHYRVYDPASSTWGLDTMLSNDRDLESAFAPVWDANGNLVLAYLNTAIVNQSKTVSVAGGGTITVNGVPQPGQVNLLLARRAIVTDLSIPTNGLTATGTTFLPGDTITLNAKVQNSGNLAVQNVAVGFYDGDPTAGGTLIQTVTVPGWLKASDQAAVTANWTVPSPALPHTVYVKADPLNAVTESTKTNNVLSLPLNGVNLQVDYVSGSVLKDGSVHVVARVSNISAPASPVTTLRLKTGDGTTTLASVAVSQLDPGTSVEIPLDLPAGSQAEGDTSYSLTVDDEGLTGDVDTSNNKVLFTLNLFISTVNDGISNVWKQQYGFSTTDPTVANADPDHDGFTNLQEYLAGTNPLNSSSVLKIAQVTRQSPTQGGGNAITWASVAGRLYNLERSYDMVNWAVIARNVTAAPPLNTVTDPYAPPFGSAFYRLSVLGSADTYDYSPMTRPVAFHAQNVAAQGAIMAQLSWSSLAGRTYSVERSTDLVNWQVISENITATLPSNTLTDKAPLSQTKAFYRVLEH